MGTIAGIVDLQILPGCAASAQEGKGELVGCYRRASGDTGGVDQINIVDIAVAEIEVIRIEVFTSIVLANLGGVVIDEIVKSEISSRAVVAHHVVQLVQLHVLELGEAGGKILEAKWIHIFHFGLVINEAPLQSGGHQPVSFLGALTFQVAQVHREAWVDRVGLATHRRADQLEVDQQTGLIVNNLGLTRSDREVVGVSIAGVMGKQAKHKGPGGLNCIGEGII